MINVHITKAKSGLVSRVSPILHLTSNMFRNGKIILVRERSLYFCAVLNDSAILSLQA